MARDPVCGAEVDELRARAVAIVGGTTYYFCSAAHKEAFLAERSGKVTAPAPEAKSTPPKSPPRAEAKSAAKPAPAPSTTAAPPEPRAPAPDAPGPVEEAAPPAPKRARGAWVVVFLLVAFAVAAVIYLTRPRA